MTSRSGIPRPVEIIIAILGLAIASPIIVIAALLVKITSAGPAFFKQKRVGRGFKLFTLFKLRTMSTNAGGPLVTSAGDDRITPVGRVLRKTKIDELPSLWNVLLGDMSFVGPRPEVPQYVDAKDEQWHRVLSARPGITDPVTVTLRNEQELLDSVPDADRFYREVLQPYKLRGYIEFLKTRSATADLRVIVQTLAAVISHTASPTAEEMELSFR